MPTPSPDPVSPEHRGPALIGSRCRRFRLEAFSLVTSAGRTYNEARPAPVLSDDIAPQCKALVNPGKSCLAVVLSEKANWPGAWAACHTGHLHFPANGRTTPEPG